MTVENTRNWLTGAFVKPEEIMLNEVESRERALLLFKCGMADDDGVVALRS
jgi:hypothetical protein